MYLPRVLGRLLIVYDRFSQPSLLYGEVRYLRDMSPLGQDEFIFQNGSLLWPSFFLSMNADCVCFS